MAMTMTDPIADMLTRLRNANSAYHDTVSMPYSKLKAGIADILQQEGYISGSHVEEAEVGKNLVLELKFGPSRERSIAGLRRVTASRAAVIATLEPVYGIMLAALWLGERPGLRVLTGGTLVLAAALWVTRRSAKA